MNLPDPEVIRMGIALVPTLAFIIVVGTVSPSRRRMGAAVVAAGWSLVSQAALSSLAGSAGWWVVVHGGVFGIPGDILFGWMMVWGAIPGFLADRLHPVWWTLGALTMDVVLLPVLDPVIVMGPSWIAGEALLLILSFLPGLLAARWTIQGRLPVGRALVPGIGVRRASDLDGSRGGSRLGGEGIDLWSPVAGSGESGSCPGRSARGGCGDRIRPQR